MIHTVTFVHNVNHGFKAARLYHSNMKTSASLLIVLSLTTSPSLHAQNVPQAPPPIGRLRTNIEQIAKSIDTRIPKYVGGFQTPHKTGDMVPFIANDVGLLINNKRRIVVSIFTEKHNLSAGAPTNLIGNYIEDGIARIAEQVADYFGYN